MLPFQVYTPVTVGTEGVWLGLGAALMFLGTLYFGIRGWGVEDEETKLFYVITTAIPAIAFASYLAMFLGVGVTGVRVLGEVRPIYWARYVDWVLTTPLLLVDLALLADVDRATLLGLLGADVFMIVTGLVGAMTPIYPYRFVWWAVSDVALIYILYTLYFGFSDRIRDLDESRAGTLRILRNMTLVLWTLYPIWWVLGTEGAAVVPLFVETAGFMLLDVTAKVGFGLVLLRSRPRAKRTGAVGGAGAGTVAGSATTGGTATAGDAGTAAEATPPESRFEVYEDRGGAFRWRLRAPNGHILGDSGQGYTARAGVRNAVENARTYLGEAGVLGLDPVGFEVYEDDVGDYRWRLVHRNGNVIAEAGRGYDARSGARRALDRVRKGLDGMSFEMVDDDGEYRWRLRAANNRVMAEGDQRHPDRDGAGAAIKRVRRHAPEADVVAVGHAAFEVYEDRGGEWRWRLRHRNGNVLADSGQGYASRSGVVEAVDRVADRTPDADIEEL